MIHKTIVDMRTLTNIFAFSVFILAIGCQNPSTTMQEPLSAAYIQSKIVGTWSAKKFEGLQGDVSATFRANGTAVLTRSGVTTQYANWRAESGRVILTQPRGLPSSSLDHWTVLNIDDHNFVFRRGGNTSDKKETLTR